MAKKLDSSLKNMALSLVIICGTMSAALGYVHSLTEGPIKAAEQKKINEAIKMVVPPFDNQPGEEAYYISQVTGAGNADTLKLCCYPAKKGGKLVGTAVETYTNKGFAGYVSLMVGLLPDGTIRNFAVMSQKETPGLGTRMNDPKFRDQFNGKDPAKFKLYVKKDGGNVDAITAATISSRAVCDALRRAYEAYIKNPAGNPAGQVSADTTNQSEGGVK